MYAYQISGLPGTGKSTIQRELDKLGYDTIDSDQAWGHYGHISSEAPVEKPAEAPPEWFNNHGYIWSSTQIRPTLNVVRTKPLFVCGGSRNEDRFYDLFDRIFILHIPDEIMRQRLKARSDPQSNSDFFISRMIEYNHRDVYAHARKVNGIIIDTTRPLDECVGQILEAVHES